METYENQFSLATAIAVGLLIGLEREQSKEERTTSSMAGVRTYPIFALVGALATMLEAASMWLPLVALAGVITLVAISYAADIRNAANPDHGATTEISVIGTYLLGALATSKGVVEPMADRLVLVAGLGVVIAFLLSSKKRFHSIAQRVSRDDFYATTKFLIVAVIVVPLLPDRDVGPMAAINPRTLGLLVVTISGLSFLGYVAMRMWGAKRGLMFGAALGGLVSSTAVTLSFANRTKAQPMLAPVAASAIAVAWTIMLGRVGVLVTLIAPQLLSTLAIPLAAMIVASLIGLAITFKRTSGSEEELVLTNPFDLWSAIKVTLVFGVVLLATKGALVYIGDRGLYLASALGGTTDVDAVTLSTAKLATADTITPVVATTAIVIGIGVNTLVKAGLAASIGGATLGRRVGLVGVLVLLSGGAALAVTAGLVG